LTQLRTNHNYKNQHHERSVTVEATKEEQESHEDVDLFAELIRVREQRQNKSRNDAPIGI